MSDLAPFVAAAIRDRVLDDLKKELEDLKVEHAKELAPWTVLIHGPEPPNGGAPTLYAHASVSMRDAMVQTLRRNGNIRRDRSAYVVKTLEQTENRCLFRDFLSCYVTIKCNRDPTASDGSEDFSFSQSFDDRTDIGDGINVVERTDKSGGIFGDFKIGWWWTASGPDLRRSQNMSVLVEEVEIQMPVTIDRQNRVFEDEELLEHPVITDREEALPLASEIVGGDAPIHFNSVELNAHLLISLLEGEEVDVAVDGDDDSSDSSTSAQD